MPLNSGLDLTGYRIVQEALTNVRRHARATHAGVSLRYGHGFLEIDVRERYPAGAVRAPGPRSHRYAGTGSHVRR